jgi:AraC-like DNA-binding protein
LDNIEQDFSIKELDRMVFIPVVSNGNLTIINKSDEKNHITKDDTINLYCSSRQDFIFKIKKSSNSKIFILFIADFFLKRYLSSYPNEPIDFLYNKTQSENYIEFIHTSPIDALSLHIIYKIITTKENENMISIKKEHNVIEFMIHRFSMIDFYDTNLSEEELSLAKRAKYHLLGDFISPPSIQELAHTCATNESKLKKVFKKAYKTTIYEYIQRLRLEKANLLLKERILNIGQIASEVGYKHQGHFSKLFFENYGVYPKELLKKYLE